MSKLSNFKIKWPKSVEKLENGGRLGPSVKTCPPPPPPPPPKKNGPLDPPLVEVMNSFLMYPFPPGPSQDWTFLGLGGPSPWYPSFSSHHHHMLLLLPLLLLMQLTILTAPGHPLRPLPPNIRCASNPSRRPVQLRSAVSNVRIIRHHIQYHLASAPRRAGSAAVRSTRATTAAGSERENARLKGGLTGRPSLQPTNQANVPAVRTASASIVFSAGARRCRRGPAGAGAADPRGWLPIFRRVAGHGITSRLRPGYVPITAGARNHRVNVWAAAPRGAAEEAGGAVSGS